MCADDENIKITSENTVIKTINISDILIFGKYELNDAIHKMMLAGTPFPLDSKPFTKFIIIDYLSDNLETKVIFFSLDLCSRQLKANEFFLSECNIYDVVNNHINKNVKLI